MLNAVRVPIAAAICLLSGLVWGQDEKSRLQTIDPSGDRPANEVVNDPPRYYLWYSDKKWHLRTTSNRGIRKFGGEITITGGKLHRCRPVGLDVKSKKYPDGYAIAPNRKALRFLFHTTKAFDGLDFDVRPDKTAEAEITFALKIRGKGARKSVFIGKERKRPTTMPFSFPAEP